MGDDGTATLTWRFVESEDGGLSLILEPPHPLFHEAFEDAVGTWVLLEGEEVLSTYWVDLLVDRLERWSDSPGVEQLLVEGNISELIKVDDFLVARDTIFDVADERLAVSDALPALHDWRRELLNRGASSEPPDSLRQAATPMPPPE